MIRNHLRRVTNVLAVVFPWHVNQVRELNTRIEEAQQHLDAANNRVQQAEKAAARARRYRQENSFGAMIADSLGIGHTSK
jgi:hypothetical protein